MMFWPRCCESYEKFPVNFLQLFLVMMMIMIRHLPLLAMDLRNNQNDNRNLQPHPVRVMNAMFDALHPFSLQKLAKTSYLMRALYCFFMLLLCDRCLSPSTSQRTCFSAPNSAQKSRCTSRSARGTPSSRTCRRCANTASTRSW